MSVHDERELRDRLTGLLDGLEPSPAPVASAVRRGKGIRMRRWISVAAGLAVIVVGAAFLPGLLRPPRTAPAGHPHYRVTVHPAGRHSPLGLIAYGSVNAKKWRATASHQGKSILVSLCGSNYAALSYPGAVGPSGITAFSGGNTSNANDWCMVSEVSRGVSMITMALDNGQSIGLQPVSYRGVPLIAFALPAHGRILRLTAFEGARMVAYAIPFNEPASQTIASWLRPGQPAPAVSAARLQAALHGRGRWTASVHVGPWGMCAVIRFSKGVDTGCGPMRPQMQLVSFAFGSGNGPTVVGTQADVAYLVLTMKNGTTDRVTVAHIAGTGYFAIGASRDSGLAGWTAYNAAGKELGGGTGVPGAH